MSNIKVDFDGIFKDNLFKVFTNQKRLEVRSSIKKGFEKAGPPIRDELRSDARNNLKIKKKTFLNLLNYKVIDKYPDKNPLLVLGNRRNNRIFIGQENGGIIRGKRNGLLIPLLSDRVGPKKFQQIMRNLIQNGNAFFVKKGNKTIVFAENIKENTRDLSKFKKEFRNKTGRKSVKKGTEIPIAIFVPSVTLKKKLNVQRISERNIPFIAKSIENNFVFKD